MHGYGHGGSGDGRRQGAHVDGVEDVDIAAVLHGAGDGDREVDDDVGDLFDQHIARHPAQLARVLCAVVRVHVDLHATPPYTRATHAADSHA